MGNLRDLMYVVSETICLVEKSGTTQFGADDKKVLANYKKHIDLSTTLESSELDQLRYAYKDSVEQWSSSIRAEENLASPDHTIHAVDVWEHAGFIEEEARKKAKEARQAYEDALRTVNFNF